MLFFSELGLCELRAHLMQSKPYIGKDSYNQLWSIISAIGADRATTQHSYEQIVHLLEPYTRQQSATGVESLPRSEEAECLQGLEEGISSIEPDTVIRAFRYFLLSYSGIENFEPAADGHSNEAVHCIGRENHYG